MTTLSSRELQASREYHRRREERERRRREGQRTSVLKKLRAQVRRLAPQFPGIRAVYVFGSVLQPGRFKSSSDLDLALEIDDLEQEGPFALALEESLGWPIDVRPYEGAVRQAVETDGETIYEREDPSTRAVTP